MLTQQAYEAAVLRLACDLRDVLRDGGLARVQVAHDDWCPKLRGGRCTCDPVVRVVEVWPGGDTAGMFNHKPARGDET